jgi:DNA-binding SARP family transcriptional activator
VEPDDLRHHATERLGAVAMAVAIEQCVTPRIEHAEAIEEEHRRTVCVRLELEPAIEKELLLSGGHRLPGRGLAARIGLPLPPTSRPALADISSGIVLRINTLGCLAVAGDDGPLAGAAAQPRRLAVLALVARAGERGITRSKVLGYLWPDADEERGRSTLTKALSALRHDLGSEDLFLAGNDLRLNSDVITSDVTEFEDSVAAGRLEHAASLYEGPFLDGFRLPGAPEFERWAEEERAALEHEYETLLERLATRATTSGAPGSAVGWWRKLAATDTLSSRYALGLMEAMIAAGDRAGALQHARVYEALVEQELDVEPDREVVALARRLRSERGPASDISAPAVPVNASPVVAPVDAASQPEGSSPISSADGPPASVAASRPPDRRAWLVRTPTLVAAGALIATALLIALGVWLRGTSPRPASGTVSPPVIALGRITDYRAPGAGDLARPLTDMLATNLARVSALRVVSNARMYEIVSQMRAAPGQDTLGATLVAAARRVGATELVDGAVYDIGGGRLRLDLRRVDLATGDVRQALSVIGGDPFALADSGTARLVAALGGNGPAGSVADVTTKSIAAYRLYDEGLRAYYRNEMPRAASLFEAALREDSTFAMAAYYDVLANSNSTPLARSSSRALRLAAGATDRERLTILAGFARAAFSPDLAAIAETLMVRYPLEVEGHFYTGEGMVQGGDNLGAIPYFERVVSMDSLSLGGQLARCMACEALQDIVTAYTRVDSLGRAEREARRWIALQPRSTEAWRKLVEVLTYEGRTTEASNDLRTWMAFDVGHRSSEAFINAMIAITAGDFPGAERALDEAIHSADAARRSEAYWYLAISHRHAGRLQQALDDARRHRSLGTLPEPPGTAAGPAVMQAQVLFEQGHYRESAALFDSIARWSVMYREPSMRAKFQAFSMANAASAHAAAGDTGLLAAFADTIRVIAAQSGNDRDRRVEHHVRALLLRARHQDDQAIAEFRIAIGSPNEGYTRTNLELGRLLLAHDRAQEAIATLRPAIHGSIESSNLYVTRTELYEALGQAWHALAQHDSAAAYSGRVLRAWANADPSFGTRLAAARRVVDAR